MQTFVLCFFAFLFHRNMENHSIPLPARVGNAALSVPPHRSKVRGTPLKKMNLEILSKFEFSLYTRVPST